MLRGVAVNLVVREKVDHLALHPHAERKSVASSAATLARSDMSGSWSRARVVPARVVPARVVPARVLGVLHIHVRE